jgi:hypothetical protein
MAYLRRLIHRAAVWRCPIVRGGLGQDTPGAPAVVTGYEALPCLLLQDQTDRIQRAFGPDLDADSIVEFAAGVELRPRIGLSDGQNDILVVTDERGVVSRWMVKATKDPGSARKMTWAAVKLVTG